MNWKSTFEALGKSLFNPVRWAAIVILIGYTLVGGSVWLFIHDYVGWSILFLLIALLIPISGAWRQE